jgi:hypothetical protein
MEAVVYSETIAVSQITSSWHIPEDKEFSLVYFSGNILCFIPGIYIYTLLEVE